MIRVLLIMLLLACPVVVHGQQSPEIEPVVDEAETSEEPEAETSPESEPEEEEDSTQVVGVALYVGGGAAAVFLFLVVGGLAVYFARRHPSAPNVGEV